MRPTAVFVAGLGSGDYLCRHAELLADERRVLLPDMPGFGRSRTSHRLRTVEEFAAALLEMLRSETSGPVDLVGNSFGTQIALAAADASPEAVRRLVLIGPTFDASARSYPHMLGRWLLTAPIEPPSLAVSLLRSYLKCGVRTPALAFRAGMRDRPEERIERVSHPILLIRGVRDRIAPRPWLEDLQRQSTNVEIAEVPRTAHTVDFAAPEAAARLVADFLDR
ncbi:MAG TPA: alpha/beta hydrolase [Mycobacteriales bacterium]|nr:alpha/beta hydrolase [Mycobacteriales bacterium]